MNPTFEKWKKYEFWSFWAFYAPLTPWFLYKIIKSGAPAYFCSANPGIKWGGFINYSKIDLINQIEDKYKPKTFFYATFYQKQILIKFPFIIKPNHGERGAGVELIRNNSDLDNYLSNHDNSNLIIQEYIDYPLEFGVFYVRLPKENKGKIISITSKEFLTIIGDGKRSLKELIEKNTRAFYRKEYLFERYKNDLKLVLKEKQELMIEPIGNHSRGTTFLDATNLKTHNLEMIVDSIAQQINGFFYGRIDLKAKSIEDFQNGKFVILEINGSNSEATHIYDPKYNIIKAYKEVLIHLNYQYKIALQNHELGLQWTNWKLLAKEILARFKTKK